MMKRDDNLWTCDNFGAESFGLSKPSPFPEGPNRCAVSVYLWANGDMDVYADKAGFDRIGGLSHTKSGSNRRGKTNGGRPLSMSVKL